MSTLVPYVRGLYEHDGIAFDEADVRRALIGLIADPALGAGVADPRGGQPAGYLVLTFGYSIECPADATPSWTSYSSREGQRAAAWARRRAALRRRRVPGP
ncbi:MAG: hypothetical protein U0531_01950 [Dehalococcoidia bacterium]